MTVFQAQGQVNDHFLGLGYKGGRPHPDTRYGSLITFSNGFDLSYSTKYGKEKSWAKILDSPISTLTLNYTDFGNPGIGKSVAVIYTLGVPIIQFDHFTLTGIFGSGGAYFSNKHNEETNPENQAVGSNITFIIRFASELKYELGKWGLGIRWDLDHYSTAAMAQPNIGINKNTFGIMAYRTIGKSQVETESREFEYQKNINLIFSGGFREVEDKKFNHWNLYGMYGFKWSSFASINVGTGLFINNSLEREQELAGIVNPKKIRWGVMVGPQLYFGKVVTNLNFGWYLIDPFNDDGRSYQHIMSRYFFNQHLSVAASLIAHNFNESYSLDFGMGISF